MRQDFLKNMAAWSLEPVDRMLGFLLCAVLLHCRSFNCSLFTGLSAYFLSSNEMNTWSGWNQAIASAIVEYATSLLQSSCTVLAESEQTVCPCTAHPAASVPSSINTSDPVPFTAMHAHHKAFTLLIKPSPCYFLPIFLVHVDLSFIYPKNAVPALSLMGYFCLCNNTCRLMACPLALKAPLCSTFAGSKQQFPNANGISSRPFTCLINEVIAHTCPLGSFWANYIWSFEKLRDGFKLKLNLNLTSSLRFLVLQARMERACKYFK